ncbi:MAG: hypothetical protein PWP43_449 [Bacillota bacterium]|nr:hypothetical protein [Bacillota bacterium]
MKFEQRMSVTGRIYGALIGLIASGLCIVLCYLFPMWWGIDWLPVLYFPIGFWLGYTYDRINTLANFDYLTGVANRRLLIRTLFRCLEKATNSGTPLSVIFIDVDNFKGINDTHGHEQGDAALRIVADRIKANLRPTDMVGRLGGDEFVIICPGAGRTQSEGIAQRIKESFKSTALGNIKLSISTGISVYPEDGSTIDELLSCADQVMYRKKERKPAGRGRLEQLDCAFEIHL